MPSKNPNPPTGERILAARRAAELTQVQVAELSGISQSKLSKYERGEKSPQLETVKRIGDAIGVDWKDLLPD